ncbi:TetR/AcrR family transcriptional regulator [Yoonia sp. 2307UL14-13]|uniref:TetR/AcrR family transcriptional regulator n=1 Tax=Yoonia sp. 2307UL14-13 TaxID=3126506 RepID=UPI0030A3E38A
MARPKSYNRDEAITKACYAFWEHGYAALGIRAIEDLTGLNKFAIRTEFGGKEGLYLAALTHYHQAAKHTVLAPLKTGGLPAIRDFFTGLISDGSINSSPWGCLMVNTGIENAEIDSAALKETSDAYWTDLHTHFCAALEHTDLPVEDTATGLVNAAMGIHTANRIAGSAHGGRYLVTLIHQMLDQWEAGHASPTH